MSNVQGKEMTPEVTAGTVVVQRWDATEGLVEEKMAFTSINELFGRCLEIRSGETVDRVVLDGIDQYGSPRRLTLAFHSATVSEPPAPHG